MQEGEEDLNKLSLEQKLNHKNWKARVSGYEELSQLLIKTRSVPVYAGEVLRTCAGDSNIAAQESALSLLITSVSIVEIHSILLRYRSQIVSLIIDKCLKSTRQGTRQKSVDLLLSLIDIETPDLVVEKLIAGTGQKVAKVVATCLAILSDIARFYGPKTVDFKPIIKILSKMFSHSDQSVRNEAQNLCVVIFQWIGIKPFESQLFNELKPVQVKELNDAFTLVANEKLVQTRFLLSQKDSDQQQQDVVEDDGQNSGEKEQDQDDDDFDVDAYCDPVDILQKIPKDLEGKLSDTKWKERKEILEQLLNVLNVPAIADGNYQFLIGLLSKRINDVNTIVATLAINCIEKLAVGLKKSFNYRNMVNRSLFEKFKEKKQNVVEALRNSLDAVYKFQSVQELFSDSLEHLNNKVPQVRSETILVNVRFIQTHKIELSKSDSKQFIPQFVKALDDATPEVRDAAMQLLGQLVKKIGDGQMSSFLSGLDSTKMEKIREYSGLQSSQGSDSNLKTGSLPLKQASTTSMSSINKIGVKKFQSRPSSGPRKSIPAKQNSTLGASKNANKNLNQAEAQHQAQSNEVTYAWSDESAGQTCNDLFTESLPLLNSGNWKERLEALERFNVDFLMQTLSSQKSPSELFIRFLKQQKIWNDSIFQVTFKLFEMFKSLSETDTSVKIDKTSGSLICPLLFEKVGDIKLMKPSTECLTILMENLGCGFVLSFIGDIIKKAKAPKLISELLKFCSTSLNEFGIQNVDVKELVIICKDNISNSNAMVRNSSVQLLGTLRVFIGEDIKMLLEGLNQQQMNLVQAEFDKVKHLDKPQPTRKQASDQLVNASSVQDLIPEKDLMQSLSEDICIKLSNSNWKIRKEALDEILDNLKKFSKVKISLSDFNSALFNLLKDNNKNLVVQTLEIIGLLAKSAGKQFLLQLKPNADLMFANYVDKKQQVKQAVSQCLTHISQTADKSLVKDILLIGLNQKQALQKAEIFAWLTANDDDCQLVGLSDISSALTTCLADKNVEVRQIAQKYTTQILIKCNSQQSVIQALEKNKADKQSLIFLGAVSSNNLGHSSSSHSLPKTPGVERKKVLTQLSSKVPLQSKGKKSLASMGSMSSIQTSMASLNVDDDFPFRSQLDAQTKLRRLQSDKQKHIWTLESSKSEMIDLLKHQAHNSFSEQLMKLAFDEGVHKDKSAQSALSLIQDSVSIQDCYKNIPQDQKLLSILENSDLIFKFLSIKLQENITSYTLKSLTIIQALLRIFAQCNENPSEQEFNCFFPYVVQKLGDAKDNIRIMVHEIIAQCCVLFPASKILLSLLSQLKDKNSRLRCECLEEVRFLISKNGASIINPQKHIPIISQLFSDKDSSVRTSTQKLLIECYSSFGEEIFKHSKLSNNDKVSLMDKINKSGITTNHIQPVQVQNNPEVSIPISNVSKPIVDVQVSNDAKFTINEFNNELEMEMIISNISSENILDQINSLKNLESIIQQSPIKLQGYLDNIVMALTLHLRFSIASQKWNEYDQVVSLIRLCKHIINTLVLLFSNSDIALCVQYDIVQPLVSEIINCLTVPFGSPTEEDATIQITRALNVLMLRILENCNKNHVFEILINLLDVSVESLNAQINGNQKFAELTMKCIWKLTKSLKTIISQSDFSPMLLLQTIDQFFYKTSPNDWKRRLIDGKPLGEMPYRTMKTIIHELVFHIGPTLCENYPNSHKNVQGQSSVQNYLTQMTKQLFPDHQISISINQDKADSNILLDRIFESISNKESSMLAIQKLANYLSSNPDAYSDVQARLSQFSPSFQTYVQNNLQKLNQKEKTQVDHDSVEEKPSKENYKERLAKLQQMLKTQSAASSPVASPMRQNSGESLNSPSRKSSYDSSSKSSSIDAIKERLARMKSSMASLNLNTQDQ